MSTIAAAAPSPKCGPLKLNCGGFIRQDSRGDFGISYTGISSPNRNAPIPVTNSLNERATIFIPADGRKIELHPDETVFLQSEAYALGSPKVVAVAGQFFGADFALDGEKKA